MMKVSFPLMITWCSVFIMVIQFNDSTSEIMQSTDDSGSDLPLYWGWFVEAEYSSSFLTRSHKILADTLQQVPDFLKDVQNFTQQELISDILLHYKRENPEEVLHCTAMYDGVSPDYTPGAEEYSNSQIVKDCSNQESVLHAIGWILTPRTFGARIKLTDSQLLLWNQNDTEGNPKQSKLKEMLTSVPVSQVQIEISRENATDQDPDVMGNFQPTHGFGSKAHLTLGCAPGIGAVTTGYDLVDLIQLEILNNSDIRTYNLQSGGWLRNYGQGQWVFYPSKQWLLESTFLGYGSSNRSNQSVVSLSLMCLAGAFAIFYMSVLNR